ncbi:response regulator [Vannielia litorea]|uniref:Two-component system, chemotaxis family, response regulator CheY n=1 Tax=Vannielia litorea TaxID=1217970 RepID=A0A1N6F2X0_9RHOB|nr:response regulator [Vannielia litorea]SIN89589.1 two-component system, chemotaxis family, response regulator CheY [Vannielia litorea]
MSLREKLHVMVVDDMSTSRGLILQALDAMGVTHVRYTADGKAALAELEKKPAHLVISDYNMPGMDGLHLLKALRTHARLKGIGFILITGKADKQIIDTGRALGMNNFIKKPFAPKDLHACMEAVVGRL